MASTFLYRAASGSVTSQTTFTFSFWIKRCSVGSERVFMHENASSHSSKFDLHFDSNDKWNIGHYNGSVEYNVRTDMLFRDFNAWYHIVTRVDTTQSTEADRYRVYVNGNQVNLTEFGSGYPPQNFNLNLGAKIIVYGRYQASSPSSYFDGYLSHCHYADGQSYAPTVFGSTDTTTGEWKIKTDVSVTYGTNGHFMFKDDNSLNDDSGNGNNFTLGSGTFTKTEDCPSNVFATLNPLIPTVPTAGTNSGTTGTLTHANLTWTSTNATWNSRGSGNMFVDTGKFYWETKMNTGGDFNAFIGISPTTTVHEYFDGTMGKTGNFAYYKSGQKYIGSSASSYGDAWVAGDIIGTALDATNSKLYFSKNGTWQNSGDPTSGATGTGAIPIDANTLYTPRCTIHNMGMSFNFGNGYFGTTAVSSAGTNASGNGIFEYDVPTGFTALSTKGLNT
jgi:hypothetical protein